MNEFPTMRTSRHAVFVPIGSIPVWDLPSFRADEEIVLMVPRSHPCVQLMDSMQTLTQALQGLTDGFAQLGTSAMTTDEMIQSFREPKCDEDCPLCSGESCIIHGHDPCDCDTIERHYGNDIDGDDE